VIRYLSAKIKSQRPDPSSDAIRPLRSKPSMSDIGILRHLTFTSTVSAYNLKALPVSHPATQTLAPSQATPTKLLLRGLRNSTFPSLGRISTTYP